MAIPRDKSLDSTLALLSEPYTFISNLCKRYQSDIFETRIMFRKAICTMGAGATRMFYYPGRFTRKAALPPTTLMLLQDKGSVMTLDAEAHRHRKQMFMSLLAPESTQELMDITADTWRSRLATWERLDAVVLHFEVQAILGRAVCQWAGLRLRAPDVKLRIQEFAAMVDGAGSVGPRNWRAMALRMRSEFWARGIIAAIRSDKLDVPAGTAAHSAAWHRDLDGQLLPTNVAAVGLINLLRPIVAVALEKGSRLIS